MRARPPYNWSKVQPDRLTPRAVRAKKLEIPFVPVVNRKTLKTESVKSTPPHRQTQHRPTPLFITHTHTHTTTTQLSCTVLKGNSVY